MPHYGVHGTFLHFGLQGSRLNTCYYHQDLHSGPLHAISQFSASQLEPDALLLTAAFPPRGARPWSCIGGALERHPFSGLVHSAGELLHTP